MAVSDIINFWTFNFIEFDGFKKFLSKKTLTSRCKFKCAQWFFFSYTLLSQWETFGDVWAKFAQWPIFNQQPTLTGTQCRVPGNVGIRSTNGPCANLAKVAADYWPLAQSGTQCNSAQCASKMPAILGVLCVNFNYQNGRQDRLVKVHCARSQHLVKNHCSWHCAQKITRYSLPSDKPLKSCRLIALPEKIRVS